MLIHVVLSGESIDEIAERYGISATSLIQDNGLASGISLVHYYH